MEPQKENSSIPTVGIDEFSFCGSNPIPVEPPKKKQKNTSK
jgi:hypothetical protein